MFLTIFSGEADWADVFFLVGTVLAVVAGIGYLAKQPATWLLTGLGWLAVAAVAFGFLLL